jgi:hypothetical protein
MLMVQRPRFDPIDQEQLAAQVISIMDAHFQRPTIEEKLHILELARKQVAVQPDDMTE